MRVDYASHDTLYRMREADGYAGWDATEESYERRAAAWPGLVSTLGLPRTGRLLEIGCGAGNIAVWYAEQGYDVSGVDIAPTAIKWARKRAMNHNVRTDFRVGNVVDLADYPDGEFALVIDGKCLHCIIGDDRRKCLANVCRVLKSGGWFCVSTMCRTNRYVSMHGFDPATGIVLNGDIAIRYLGKPEEILEEVRDAGFQITRSDLDTTKQDQDNGVAALSVFARKP